MTAAKPASGSLTSKLSTSRTGTPATSKPFSEILQDIDLVWQNFAPLSKPILNLWVNFGFSPTG